MSEHEFLLKRFACIDEAGENEVLEDDKDLFFTVLILQRPGTHDESVILVVRLTNLLLILMDITECSVDFVMTASCEVVVSSTTPRKEFWLQFSETEIPRVLRVLNHVQKMPARVDFKGVLYVDANWQNERILECLRMVLEDKDGSEEYDKPVSRELIDYVKSCIRHQGVFNKSRDKMNQSTSIWEVEDLDEFAEKESQELILDQEQELNLYQEQELNLGQKQELNLGQKQELNLGQKQELNLDQEQQLNLDQEQELNPEKNYDEKNMMSDYFDIYSVEE
ncbi:involucrin [Eurytemora carolleeae]|uniref:involucrin n=1 Tax=Eurytemora carolleeae TaxID=1294199 RepID=UPI000C787394|nr:involucrin [Eurytemora carolleeae]|eukprot:XP_023325089.1 involucrin-like [Eurytemora affinis]